MKKSLLFFMASAVISLPIFSMEPEKKCSIYPIPQELCTLAEKSAYIIAQNIYVSANKNAKCASHLLHDISLTTKNLYQALDKERNDPITARTIIEQFALSDKEFCLYTAKRLTFPGAKKCFELSKELYCKHLSPYGLKELFKQGAILNYQSMYSGSPLSYWTKSTHPYSGLIVEKLIALGANPNCESISGENSFLVAIGMQNRDKLNALLDYYRHIHGTSTLSTPVWRKILLLYYGNLRTFRICPELTDLLIAHVPTQSCSAGLIAALDVKEDLEKEKRTQLIKKFIDRGANTGQALTHLLEQVSLSGPHYPDSDFIKDFNILCKAGAFSTEALTSLMNIRELFGSLIIKVAKNSPK